MAEKRKIEKIEHDGNTYYFIDGIIVDEYYIALSENIQAEVACAYFSKIDYKFLSIDEAKDFMISAKNNGAYDIAYRAGLYYLEKRDLTTQEVRLILPVFISICRKMGSSNKAIEYAEKYLTESGAYSSVALLTSLAAAYCDKGDYIKARAVCDRAYAMQGGGVGYNNELSLVYGRIKKALGENG